MSEDRFSGRISTHVDAAARGFDRAVRTYMRHGRDVTDALADSLRYDRDLAAAHAFAGLVQILLARQETLEAARLHSRQARKAVSRRPVDGWELALVMALQQACDGYWKGAAQTLREAINPRSPSPVLVKLAHSLLFMAGDRNGMLELTAPIAGHGDGHAAGHGYILGCHAFALEENGHFEAAEQTAHRALHYAADDIWAMHALAHVYDATNRTAEGLLWVESGRQSWSLCNNFAHHMAWHLALFNSERGAFDRALEIYDRDLRNTRTDDFRDFANAVSLMQRLSHMGVDVGDRFDELYAIGWNRKSDVTSVFACLHHLLPLLVRKDIAAVSELMDAMRARAAGKGDQPEVAGSTGIPLAETLTAYALRGENGNDLLDIARKLPALGGSNTQRDIFMWSLILMADDACDHRTVASLAALRGKMRQADAFSTMIEQRMCFGTPTRQSNVA